MRIEGLIIIVYSDGTLNNKINYRKEQEASTETFFQLKKEIQLASNGNDNDHLTVNIIATTVECPCVSRNSHFRRHKERNNKGGGIVKRRRRRRHRV